MCFLLSFFSPPWVDICQGFNRAPDKRKSDQIYWRPRKFFSLSHFSLLLIDRRLLFLSPSTLTVLDFISNATKYRTLFPSRLRTLSNRSRTSPTENSSNKSWCNCRPKKKVGQSPDSETGRRNYSPRGCLRSRQHSDWLWNAFEPTLRLFLIRPLFERLMQ